MQDIVQYIKIRLQGDPVCIGNANAGAKFQDGLIDSGTRGMGTIG